jgi:hypothetical protein
LNYDGQLKLALMQPGFMGEQILAIKFRNYISFYKLIIKKRFVVLVLIFCLFYENNKKIFQQRKNNDFMLKQKGI